MKTTISKNASVQGTALLVALSYLRFRLDWAVYWREAVSEPLVFLAIYAGGWVATLWFQGLYQPRARWTIASEFGDILRATVVMALASLSFLFLFKLPDVSRLFLLYLFPAQAGATLLTRVLLRRLFEALRRRGEPASYVLIVGAGPAGAAAAIYAARKGIRTGIVAERFGGQTLDTLAIENFISVPETEGPKFAAALEQHVRVYEVDVMSGQRVAALEPAPTPGALASVRLDNGAVLKSRTVILATGARWRNVNVPGEQEYKTKGVAYCPHCDGPLFKGKKVAVIGGGNSGVEAAIDLAGVVEHVTLIEFLDQLKADAVLVSKLKSLPNVTIHTNAQTTEITGDGQKVNGLRYKDRASGAEHLIELAGVFVQIGLVPNTDFLKGGPVELSRFGEIVIDAKCHTSVPGVFGAGDATTVPYKQIIIATGEGAKAALSAFDHLIRTPQVEAAPAATAASPALVG